jgi:hypothetical protein
MRLIDELTECAAREPSLFRAQLMREDAARLAKLAELARSTPDPQAYRRAARRIGWTAQDARTGELGDALDRLLDAVRDYALANPESADTEDGIRDAWLALTRVRVERLVGCLSTPVPKPAD